MYGLSEGNIKELRDILSSCPHIEQAIIFGSRVRGDYRPGSDVDLSLKGKEWKIRTFLTSLIRTFIPVFGIKTLLMI